MSAGFCFIRQIDEAPEGLRLIFDGASPARLRADHPEYGELGELFHHLHQEAQRQGLERPTWLTVSDSGDIEEARLVACGVPLSATSDEAGGHWIVFPFTNCSMRLRADHARFGEFEGFLLEALKHDTPLFWVASPDDRYSIDDLLPDDGRCPSSHHLASIPDQRSAQAALAASLP